MTTMSENQLMTRAAWLYYVGGLNQEATSQRMGLTRARVNKLLQQARESGLVSITINDRDIGLLPVEEALRREFGLEFCLATPAFGSVEPGTGAGGVLSAVHADEGAAPGRDQVDAQDVPVLPEQVTQVLLVYQLREVAHPQSRAAHWNGERGVSRGVGWG